MKGKANEKEGDEEGEAGGRGRRRFSTVKHAEQEKEMEEVD